MNIWRVGVIVILMAGCAGARPANMGVTNGKFIPCPDSPNCVCSQYPDKSHAIEPISYQGPPESAWVRLVSVIQGMTAMFVVSSFAT